MSRKSLVPIVLPADPAVPMEASTKQYVDAQISIVTAGGLPPGVVVMWLEATAPSGWLILNGQSTTGYPTLAAKFGANLPDLRTRVPFGAGTQFAVNTNEGVAEASRDIRHAHSMAGHTHDIGVTGTNTTTATGGTDRVTKVGGVGPSGTATTATASPGASSLNAINSLPYLAVNFIIKY